MSDMLFKADTFEYEVQVDMNFSHEYSEDWRPNGSWSNRQSALNAKREFEKERPHLRFRLVRRDIRTITSLVEGPRDDRKHSERPNTSRTG